MKSNCKEVPNETKNSFSVAEKISFKEAVECMEDEHKYIYGLKTYINEDEYDLEEFIHIESVGELFAYDDMGYDFYVFRHFECQDFEPNIDDTEFL